MKIRISDTLEEFQRYFGLSRKGVLLEDDLDVVEVDTDAHGRKQRDAEVLCTLAANSSVDVLEFGTSQGCRALKLASNLMSGLRFHTVNIRSERYSFSGVDILTYWVSNDI